MQSIVLKAIKVAARTRSSGRLCFGKNGALLLVVPTSCCTSFAKHRDMARRCDEVPHDVGTKLQGTVFTKMRVAARTNSSGRMRLCLRHVVPRFAKPHDVAPTCSEVQHDVGQNCREFLPKCRLPTGQIRATACVLCHAAPRFAKHRDVTLRFKEVQHNKGTKCRAQFVFKTQVASRTYSSGHVRVSCLRHVASRFANPCKRETRCKEFQALCFVTMLVAARIHSSSRQQWCPVIFAPTSCCTSFAQASRKGNKVQQGKQFLHLRHVQHDAGTTMQSTVFV